MEDELLEELVSLAPASINEQEAQVEVFRHYAKHQDTYRTLIHAPSSSIIKREMDALLKRNSLLQLPEGSRGKELVISRLFLRYAMMGSMALIESWIDAGCDMSSEELAAISHQFARHGLDGITPMHEA